MLNWIAWNKMFLCVKMGLALNNLRWLISINPNQTKLIIAKLISTLDFYSLQSFLSHAMRKGMNQLFTCYRQTVEQRRTTCRERQFEESKGCSVFRRPSGVRTKRLLSSIAWSRGSFRLGSAYQKRLEFFFNAWSATNRECWVGIKYSFAMATHEYRITHHNKITSYQIWLSEKSNKDPTYYHVCDQWVRVIYYL